MIVSRRTLLEKEREAQREELVADLFVGMVATGTVTRIVEFGVFVDLGGVEGLIPLKEIAKRQDISEKYLESIVKSLVKGGVVEGMRGKGGGYRLCKSPDQFTTGQILRLMEGSLAPVACLEAGSSPCDRAGECRTLSLWAGLNDVINKYLDQYTLADLLREDGDYDYVI